MDHIPYDVKPFRFCKASSSCTSSVELVGSIESWRSERSELTARGTCGRYGCRPENGIYPKHIVVSLGTIMIKYDKPYRIQTSRHYPNTNKNTKYFLTNIFHEP